MDVVVETDQHRSLSNDGKSLSSPRPGFGDDVGDDILLDRFFDSEPLDSNALDALLNTKFTLAVDDVDDERSTNASTAKWRPTESGSLSQQRSPPTSGLELSSPHAKQVTLKPAQAAHPFTPQQQHMYESTTFATSLYHNHAHPTTRSTSSPHQQRSMMVGNRTFTLDQLPAMTGPHQNYQNSAPVAMPTMHDVYSDAPTQFHQPGYYSPSNVSRQGTADLMDYENTILEEDEAGETMNGEIADPCYAQLLYRCLREAPDHTMALKDVYKWVRQYSQKARDSTGTGWQNSVRHNLSMNAAFERVTASALHGQKKGSLWRLTHRALQDGVISTTRYRKDPKRKPVRHSSPALKRQLSGAKGGLATRAASAHRRAMQARAMGTSNFNTPDRHQRAYHRFDQQQPSFFTPTSTPSSNRATASPQPGWAPHGLHSHPPQHNSMPASPYFVQSVEAADPYAMGPPQSISNPHTPPQIHVDFGAPPKAAAATTLSSPSKGFLGEFQLAYNDSAMGLFGNHDDFDPNTPSLDTELSFTADESPFSRHSLSVEPMRV